MNHEDAGFKSPSLFLESSVNESQSFQKEAQPASPTSSLHYCSSRTPTAHQCYKDILFKALKFPNPIFVIHRDPIKHPSRRFSKRMNMSSEKTRATKNIIKNFGLAISAFIASDLIKPYIKSSFPESYQHLEDFRQHIQEKKESLTNIIMIRKMLNETSEDTDTQKIYRKMYKLSAETFIKYFSVNWIYNSKLKYKSSHVKFRGKLLRRIRNPKFFTYMA